MATNVPDGGPNLGAIIGERRESLGLTKSEAARRAGLSRGTWHGVESGQRTNMLAGTLDLFDQALAWERGTLRSLSSGRRVAAGDQTAGRRRLVELAATMTPEQVQTVVSYAEYVVGGARAGGRDDSGGPA